MFVLLRKVALAVALLSFFQCLSIKSLVGFWTAAVFSIVALGFFSRTLQSAPGKDPKTGSISLWRLLIFLPYYTVVLFIMIFGIVNSWLRGLDSYTRLTGDVYVGDYFSSWSKGVSWGSIVDITNELPRLGRSSQYLNIPSWDGTPPSPTEIQRGVEFMSKCKKPVLVHCAHGKGRSVTVVVAFLRFSGTCKTIQDAIEKVCIILIILFVSCSVKSCAASPALTPL
jgi:hypothetical protein